MPLALAVVAGFLLGGPVPAAAQSSVEALAVELESADRGVRRRAAEALGEDGSEAAVAVLAAAADDADRGVRRAAIRSLTSLRRPDAAPVLLGFLSDEERDHRREVVSGLVAIYGREAPPGFGARAVNWLMRRDDEFVPDPLRPVPGEVAAALEARLGDEDNEVRRRAAAGLGALAMETAAPALARAAAADADRGVSREAVRALGALGTDAAGEFLVGFLDEDRLRPDALEALGSFGHAPASPRLLEVYDEDPESSTGRAALAALARIGSPLARGTFYHELRSGDPRRRTAAAAGLGRLGDATLTDGLIRDFLREDHREAQLAFCFALVRLGEAPFVDRIILSLTDSDLEDAARAYLLELGSPLLDELVSYLDDPDRNLRARLVDVLERIGDPAAVPALMRVAEAGEGEAAARARLAIRRLGAAGTGI